MTANIRLRKELSDRYIVMAQQKGNYCEWVTWTEFKHDPGHYHWGHYFQTAREAVLDWNKREV